MKRTIEIESLRADGRGRDWVAHIYNRAGRCVAAVYSVRGRPLVERRAAAVAAALDAPPER